MEELKINNAWNIFMRSKYFRNIFHNMKANYEETIYYWYLQMCCNTEMLNWISQIHWKIFTIDWLTVSTLQSPNIPLPLGAHRGTPWPPKTPKIGWVPLGTHLESSYLPIRRGFIQKKRGKKKKFFWYPLLTHCATSSQFTVDLTTLNLFSSQTKNYF